MDKIDYIEDNDIMLVSIMQASAGVYLLKRTLENRGFKTTHFVLGDQRFYSVLPDRISRRDIDIFIDAVRKTTPKIIAFSVTTTKAIPVLEEISGRIKEVTGARVICGGQGATISPERAIFAADGVCIGEGIYPLIEFVEAVFNRADYRNIRNFWFREREEIIKNETRPLMDINEYPVPSWEGYHYRISEGIIEKRKEPAIGVIFCSLGCPMSCSYCTSRYLRATQKGPAIRTKRVDKIINELAYFKSKGLDSFVFWDEVFPWDDKFIEEFCVKYKDGIGLPFSFWSHPNFIKEKNLIKLKESGLSYITIGIQSCSERVRRIFKRPETNEDIIEISRILGKHGIKARYDLITSPLDKWKDHAEYFKLIPKMKGIFALSIQNYIPLPKTELLDYMIDKKIVDKNFEKRNEAGYFNRARRAPRFFQLLYVPFYFLSHPAFIFNRHAFQTFAATQDLIARAYYFFRKIIKKIKKEKRPLKTFHLCSVSCRARRSTESQKIYDYLISNGFSFTRDFPRADLIVISTCAYCSEKENESVKVVKYYLRRKRGPGKIIVTGCLPGICPDFFSKTGGIESVSPQELNKFDKIIRARVPFDSVPEANKTQIFFPRIYGIKYIPRALSRVFSAGKREIFPSDNFVSIKVARGCVGDCSYCAVRHATGPLKSKPLDKIIDEFKINLKKGEKLFLLESDDLGCYGMDINASVVTLLEEIFKIEGEYKLMLHDLNPRWITRHYKELEDIFIRNFDRVEYALIPIQSGSNKILMSMNRHYDIESVARYLCSFREKAPGLKIMTHFMVGFPGETDNDFEETKNFIKKYKLTAAAVLGYTDRPNTPSFKLSDKITAGIIRKRKLDLEKTIKKYWKDNK